MRFSTEAERMQHPFAKWIPLQAWNTFFSGTLDDDCITWLQTQDLPVLLSYASHHQEDTIEKKQRLWMAFAFNRPDASIDLLLTIASTLHLPIEIQLTTCAVFSKRDEPFHTFLNMFECLIKHEASKGKAEHQAHYQLYKKTLLSSFQTAACFGNMFILDALMMRIVRTHRRIDFFQTILGSNQFKAFREAAENGHTPVVYFLVAKIASDQRQRMLASLDLSRVAANGHLAILQYYDEKCPDQLRDWITTQGAKALSSAREHRHNHIVQFLEEKCPRDPPSLSDGALILTKTPTSIEDLTRYLYQLYVIMHRALLERVNMTQRLTVALPLHHQFFKTMKQTLRRVFRLHQKTFSPGENVSPSVLLRLHAPVYKGLTDHRQLAPADLERAMNNRQGILIQSILKKCPSLLEHLPPPSEDTRQVRLDADSTSKTNPRDDARTSLPVCYQSRHS